MKEKIINFFKDVAKEMDKVTWPSREELMESTKIVIIVTLIIAVFAMGCGFCGSGNSQSNSLISGDELWINAGMY